jgi:hypothetical protein
MSAADAAGGEASLPEFKLDQVATHANKKDCWMAINGKVYDVTKFLEDHPGGPDIMLEHAGAYKPGGPALRRTGSQQVATAMPTRALPCGGGRTSPSRKPGYSRASMLPLVLMHPPPTHIVRV